MKHKPGVAHRGGGGTVASGLLNPEITAFNTFLDGLPPVLSQYGLESVFAGMKKNEKSTMEVVDRLLRCLQSQKASTQRVRDSFVTLVILLTTSSHVKTEKVLDLINQIFVTDGDNTRGERRAVYAGKILGIGALIRAGRLSSLDKKALNRIIEQLASLAEKRTSLLTIATPFLCSIFSEALKKKKNLELGPLSSLLQLSSKPQLASVFKLSLALSEQQVDIECPLLVSIESIVDNVVGVVRHDDRTCLRLLFRHLHRQKLTKEFWKVFPEKLGAYHFELLQNTILVALEHDCPLKHLLSKTVLRPLVSIFRSDEEAMTKKVVSIFRQLLDWEKPEVLSERARLAAIRLLFGKLEISAEYRSLHAILRRFTTFLSGEEIRELVTLCQGQSGLEHRGGIANITFLSSIPALRNTPLEVKLSITKELFANGFCTVQAEVPETVEPEILAMRQRLSREAFVSILKNTYDSEFVHKLFSHVRGVATGKGDLTLVKSASEEDLANFKVIRKLLKNMDDVGLSNCLQIYGIYSVVDSAFSIAGLDTLVPLCEKTLTMDPIARAPEIVTFILLAIEAELVIFDYAAIFGKLLRDKVIHADSVQHLVKVIDTDMADALDDDDESSDEGSDIDEAEANDAETAIKTPNGIQPPPSLGDDDEKDSDEESLDMDEVGDSELQKMDAALANVFSTKKRVKAERRLEETLILRVLNLLGMLLRRYSSPEDGAIPLLMLIPALTLLRKSGKSKKAEIHSRVTDVVKRLNAVRHIGNAAAFEHSLIQTAKKDIDAMLEKKLPKNVRHLVNGSLEMLQRCFPAQLSVKEVKKRKKVGLEGGVAKRRRTLSN